ncbi:MAG TPA: methyltransferase, partial [Bryobacteraceae bacterium]|nr:methyltransferase [Bryobacteraceae bacterium]
WIRNPLYVGTLLTAAGLVVASQRISLAVLFAAVFLLVYLPVIELEEQYLRQLFADFDRYAARVPMILPRGRRLPAGDGFDWRLYRHNREYQALAGLLAGAAVLVWKAFR